MRNFHNDLADLRKALTGHALYDAIRSREQLAVFMQAHVFAVWDYMGLARRLQSEIACLMTPWAAPSTANAARLVNMIVLNAENDQAPGGGMASHLDLYLSAMKEVGADTSQFNQFLSCVNASRDVHMALHVAKAPTHVRHFVQQSQDVARHGDPEAVAANFVFGRMSTVPRMFELLIQHLQINDQQAPRLTHYLQRHLKIDRHEFDGACQTILSKLVGPNPVAYTRALAAAREALKARLMLWNGILEQLPNDDVPPCWQAMPAHHERPNFAR